MLSIHAAQSRLRCCRKVRLTQWTYSSTRDNSHNAFINPPQAPPPLASSPPSRNGPLTGKTIAIKDNIVTRSCPTSAASSILPSYTSPFDATIIHLLRQSGATIHGKTNLDEFGMGSHSQHSAFSPVRNCYTRDGAALSPGGSSGGSAVAVASGECWGAIGTDTGGSVRLPAAYCGVVGFKPSYGMVSRWGVIQYANSLDTVGWVTGTVEGASRLWEVLGGYDGRDPTSLGRGLRGRIAGVRRKGEGGLRIGVPVEYNIEELSEEVKGPYVRKLRELQSDGHSLHAVSLPSTRQALSAYYVLAPAEAASNLAKYDGIRYGRRTEGPDSSPKEKLPLYARTRGEGFGEEVKRRILLGAYTLSSEAIDNYFIQAQKVRRLVQQDFDKVFSTSNPLLDNNEAGEDGVDVLMVPTAPTLPPTIAEVQQQTPLESYMNDVFTVPASLAGLPAISVPIPRTTGRSDDDVPTVGLQIIGQFGDDGMVLDAAKMIESSNSV